MSGSRRKPTPPGLPGTPLRASERDTFRMIHHAERRAPTEADAPPLSTFPGPKVKPLPGQLALGDDQF